MDISQTPEKNQEISFDEKVRLIREGKKKVTQEDVLEIIEINFAENEKLLINLKKLSTLLEETEITFIPEKKSPTP